MKMVARFIPIVIMVLLVAALSASPVLASPGHEGGHGKGGNGGNGGGKGNGKGGNDTAGTVSLSVIEGSNPYPFGSQISFAVGGGKDGMWVRNECSQNGSLVSAEYQKVEGGVAGPFTLGPTLSWAGGDADCRAFALTEMLEIISGSAMSYQVVG